ncbi:DUF5908 family protein [Thalassococcus sp. BH17M4-6]|uniref:DUF5908 family protein n=1 Tax=Thalassococcus sp. BH17M4-6 TaxID=3413148 RepID=UPI003BEA8452
MPVEIREIVLQARVVEDPRPDAARAFDRDSDELGDHLADLRHQIMAECEQMIRTALDRRSGR